VLRGVLRLRREGSRVGTGDKEDGQYLTQTDQTYRAAAHHTVSEP